jgi:hypothetical protein
VLVPHPRSPTKSLQIIFQNLGNGTPTLVCHATLEGNMDLMKTCSTNLSEDNGSF